MNQQRYWMEFLRAAGQFAHALGSLRLVNGVSARTFTIALDADTMRIIQMHTSRDGIESHTSAIRVTFQPENEGTRSYWMTLDAAKEPT